MRIIKLSSDDNDMQNSEQVEYFFESKLKEREPQGQFLLTKGRIAENGIFSGETLVFSYQGDLKYIALAKTGRMATSGQKKSDYPYFICIDVDTIVRAKGTLADLQTETGDSKNIVKTQGWPFFEESSGLQERIWKMFRAS